MKQTFILRINNNLCCLIREIICAAAPSAAHMRKQLYDPSNRLEIINANIQLTYVLIPQRRKTKQNNNVAVLMQLPQPAIRP